MSAADDVFETQSLFEQLAERLAPKGADDKVAIRVLHEELRDRRDKELFSWNRVFELLKGKARRVDAWEKEYAKRRLAALQRAEQIARENEYLEWLSDDLGRLETLGSRLPRELVDELQRAVRSARREAGAVALQASTDADEVYDQSTEYPE